MQKGCSVRWFTNHSCLYRVIDMVTSNLSFNDTPDLFPQQHPLRLHWHHSVLPVPNGFKKTRNTKQNLVTLKLPTPDIITSSVKLQLLLIKLYKDPDDRWTAFKQNYLSEADCKVFGNNIPTYGYPISVLTRLPTLYLSICNYRWEHIIHKSETLQMLNSHSLTH